MRKCLKNIIIFVQGQISSFLNGVFFNFRLDPLIRAQYTIRNVRDSVCHFERSVAT